MVIAIAAFSWDSPKLHRQRFICPMCARELQVSVNFDPAHSRCFISNLRLVSPAITNLSLQEVGTSGGRPVVFPSDLSASGISFHKRLIRHNASPSRDIRRASPMVTKFPPAAWRGRGRRLGRIQPNNVTRNYNAVGAK